jgi:hypothetical protein
VYYLVDGSVVAVGSHRELLDRQLGYRLLVSRSVDDDVHDRADEGTEIGTHNDLVAADGAYAALWRSWHGEQPRPSLHPRCPGQNSRVLGCPTDGDRPWIANGADCSCSLDTTSAHRARIPVFLQEPVLIKSWTLQRKAL